jgi:hypothetical protein
MEARWIEWIHFEHNRLHCVEEWPEGERKDATIASIRCGLEQFSKEMGGVDHTEFCPICAERQKAGPAAAQVIEMPARAA